MKILYLYTEVMGYTLATINSLIDRGAIVHLVHWDKKKLTPYNFSCTQSLVVYKRSDFKTRTLIKLTNELDPDITVVSGWQDKSYLRVSKMLISNNKIVVSGFDDQWHNTFRQNFAFLLGKFNFFSLFFSHAWITGSYQFEYARKIGFKKNQIINDLYSADLKIFEKVFQKKVLINKSNLPKKFIYVGRLEPVKGLLSLIKAWESIYSLRQEWELHLVGDGSLFNKINSISGVHVKHFMQPKDLAEELVNYGCFVLPSLFEPWGVVVHEFAAAGFPLIVSEEVGSAPTFLISGTNGYLFKSGDYLNIANVMLKIINHSEEELIKMGQISNFLSMRITPETSANNLLSLS